MLDWKYYHTKEQEAESEVRDALARYTAALDSKDTGMARRMAGKLEACTRNWAEMCEGAKETQKKEIFDGNSDYRA